jgi:hypothetical protein
MPRRPIRSKSARRPPPKPTTTARSRERLLMTTKEILPRNTINKEKGQEQEL